MRQKLNYIFFDDIVVEYANCLGNFWEKQFINDLKKYLPNLSKNGGIAIITKRNIQDIEKWFKQNELRQYVDCISNTAIM